MLWLEISRGRISLRASQRAVKLHNFDMQYCRNGEMPGAGGDSAATFGISIKGGRSFKGGSRHHGLDTVTFIHSFQFIVHHM